MNILKAQNNGTIKQYTVSSMKLEKELDEARSKINELEKNLDKALTKVSWLKENRDKWIVSYQRSEKLNDANRYLYDKFQTLEKKLDLLLGETNE